MKLILALAISASLGCRGADPPKPSTEQAPSPAAPASAPPSAAAPPSAPPSAAAPKDSKDYTADISKICDVVALSGAEPGTDRRYQTATWLGANLTTVEARRFLAGIQPLAGARKADALEAEARRVGLPACALAAEWRAPPVPVSP
jgi:hypothetical protein